MSASLRFPCPCCGYRVFQRPPGNHEKCPVCLWEDDLSQLRFPRMPGSANGVSLEQAQHNFIEFGVEQAPRGITRFLVNIEEPQRGIDYGESYPFAYTTVLYYWRETYWRRLAR